MPKRKPLPDHSVSCIEVPDLFDDEQVKELRDRFGFSAEFPLHERLNVILPCYVSVKGKRPLPANTRLLLEEALKGTKALREVLQKLGAQDELDVKLCFPLSLVPKDELVSHLRSWEQATALTLRKHPPKKGKPRDVEFFLVLVELIEIYRGGTSDKARITYDEAEESGKRYSGKLFRFVNDVLTSIGMCKSNDALGKAIQRAYRRMDKKRE